MNNDLISRVELHREQVEKVLNPSQMKPIVLYEVA